MLVPAVVAGSLCAQTHVPYLVPAGVLVLAALGHVAWWGRHDRRQRRLVAAAAALGVVLWVPPIVDQLTNDPGNIRKLVDHFGSPPEPALGWWDGARLMLAHLDVWAGFARQLTQTGRFVAPASTWRGAVVLALWAVAALVAWRVGSRALQWLHVVVGAALVLGGLSMARIFGKPWYYLTLWAWGITAVMLGAIAWSGLALIRHRLRRADPATRPRRAPWRWSALLGGSVAVVSLATAVSFADAQVPEVRLSDAVRALAGPTEAAVAAGVGAADGPDRPYQVRWSDAADIGSPGFGLLAALERDGLDVAADPYFHVPVTDHRTRERAASIAQIQLATGSYIDAWRQVPGAVEVATYEPRSVAQRFEFAATRRRLLAASGVRGSRRRGAARRHQPVRSRPRSAAVGGRPGRFHHAARPRSADGGVHRAGRRRARATNVTARLTAANRPRWWSCSKRPGNSGVGSGCSVRTVSTTS